MAMRKSDNPEPLDTIPFDEINREQGVALLELHAQRELGVSANEFLRRWRARDFPHDIDSQERWWRVSLLVPFAIQPD